MAYRNDYQALCAQCDALKRQLEQAKHGSEELKRLRAELTDKLAQLEQAKAEQLADGSVGRRLRSAGLWRGIGLSCAVVVVAGALAALFYRSSQDDDVDLPTAHVEASPVAGSAWFAKVRRHCNAVEVKDALRRYPAPTSNEGQAHLAACLALAGKNERAQQVIDALRRSARVAASRVIFAIAHPIADRGDDVAAGPAIDLVLRYQPNNDMAVYHAAMSAAGRKQDQRATRLLRRFLQIYQRDDLWRQRASEALARISSAGRKEP